MAYGWLYSNYALPVSVIDLQYGQRQDEGGFGEFLSYLEGRILPISTDNPF